MTSPPPGFENIIPISDDSDNDMEPVPEGPHIGTQIRTVLTNVRDQIEEVRNLRMTLRDEHYQVNEACVNVRNRLGTAVTDIQKLLKIFVQIPKELIDKKALFDNMSELYGDCTELKTMFQDHLNNDTLRLNQITTAFINLESCFRQIQEIGNEGKRILGLRVTPLILPEPEKIVVEKEVIVEKPIIKEIVKEIVDPKIVQENQRLRIKNERLRIRIQELKEKEPQVKTLNIIDQNLMEENGKLKEKIADLVNALNVKENRIRQELEAKSKERQRAGEILQMEQAIAANLQTEVAALKIKLQETENQRDEFEQLLEISVSELARPKVEKSIRKRKRMFQDFEVNLSIKDQNTFDVESFEHEKKIKLEERESTSHPKVVLRIQKKGEKEHIFILGCNNETKNMREGVFVELDTDEEDFSDHDDLETPEVELEGRDESVQDRIRALFEGHEEPEEEPEEEEMLLEGLNEHSPEQPTPPPSPRPEPQQEPLDYIPLFQHQQEEVNPPVENLEEEVEENLNVAQDGDDMETDEDESGEESELPEDIDYEIETIPNPDDQHIFVRYRKRNLTVIRKRFWRLRGMLPSTSVITITNLPALGLSDFLEILPRFISVIFMLKEDFSNGGRVTAIAIDLTQNRTFASEAFLSLDALGRATGTSPTEVNPNWGIVTQTYSYRQTTLCLYDFAGKIPFYIECLVLPFSVPGQGKTGKLRMVLGRDFVKKYLCSLTDTGRLIFQNQANVIYQATFEEKRCW